MAGQAVPVTLVRGEGENEGRLVFFFSLFFFFFLSFFHSFFLSFFLSSFMIVFINHVQL